MRLLACWFLWLPVFVACKASVKAEANVSANAETREFDEPIEPGSADEGSAFGDTDDAAALADTALSGARPDLLLAAEQPPPTCQCLAVHLGQPSDPAFFWQGGAPKVNPSTQLAIALSSDGVACQAAPADSLGASYWGYEERGNDIVVFVENARVGRPVTHGAIIPRPAAGGRVLVRPRDGKVPYGRALGAGGDCAIGTQTGEPSVPLKPRKDP